METTAVVTHLESYPSTGKSDAQLIRLKTKTPFPYSAGHYVMLAHDDFRLRARPQELKWTSYSIASAPTDQELTFVYTIRWTGGFTQFLAEHLRVGTVLRVKGPFGNFLLTPNEREKIFVATGAGIAPLRSMIRSLKGKWRLYYGFRNAQDFLFRVEFDGHPNVKTIASRDPTWPQKGHVQQLLESEHFSPKTQDVYLCGNPEMVRQVTEFFLKRGFEKEQIKSEQW